MTEQPVPSPKLNIRRHVVLISNRRRLMHVDKNHIGSDLEDISENYADGSVFQDLSTGERRQMNAIATCTSCWSFARVVAEADPQEKAA